MDLLRRTEKPFPDLSDPDYSFHDFPHAGVMNMYSHLFLDDPRRTGILLSGDGAKLYLGREGDSQVWLFVVTLVSIAPEKGRYQQRNSFIIAAVPGPNAPINVQSFAFPFFLEMANAAVGYWMWDAAAAEPFVWKGYLVSILGDQLGSAKMNGLKGHRGKFGCRFCSCEGVRAGTTYYWSLRLLCQCTDVAHQERHVSYSAEAISSGAYDRTHSTYVAKVREIEAAASAHKATLQREAGIIERPLCAGLPTFVAPWFFPIDAAHSLENNASAHFQLLITDNQQPGDRHGLSQEQVDLLSRRHHELQRWLPGCFSSRARDIVRFRNSQYKIFEWCIWVFIVSIPLLFELGWPEDLLQNWVYFVQSMELALREGEMSLKEAEIMRDGFVNYVDGFQTHYIHDSQVCLHRFKLHIHHLLHFFADTLACGHLRHHPQWHMERSIGTSKLLIHSDRHPYANLQKQLLIGEQLKIVAILYPETVPPKIPTRPRIPRVYAATDKHGVRLAWTLQSRGTGKRKTSGMWEWIRGESGLVARCNRVLGDWRDERGTYLEGDSIDSIGSTVWGKVKLPGRSYFLRSKANEQRPDSRAQRFFRVCLGFVNSRLVCSMLIGECSGPLGQQ